MPKITAKKVEALWRGLQKAAEENSFKNQWRARTFAALHHVEKHRREWVAGAGTAVLCLALIVTVIKLGAVRHSGSLELRALDNRGELQIRWDPESNLVRQAMAGKLFIIDGNERLFVKLNGARLRHGVVTYARRSDRVELRLALSEPGGRLAEEQTTFTKPQPLEAAAPGPQQAQRAALPASPSMRNPASELSQPATVAIPVSTQPNPASGLLAIANHRARKKPAVLNGTSLPFTCSDGDVFHKTDAPAGWDTFACHGKNVWSLTSHAADGASATKPAGSATTQTLNSVNGSTT